MDDHRLVTLDAVRDIIGPESPAIRHKLFSGLEPRAIEFIRRSPLLLLATADATGRPDVSPKGDKPGFVMVEHDRTLFVPDRRGNRMILGLRNLLENPMSP